MKVMLVSNPIALEDESIAADTVIKTVPACNIITIVALCLRTFLWLSFAMHSINKGLISKGKFASVSPDGFCSLGQSVRSPGERYRRIMSGDW